ncbi:2930_t:CDS:1, partial [Racocetra persica]
PQKVLHMSQLRATMNRHNRLKEIELSIKQYKQNNVALPILKENESDDVFIVDNDSDDEAEEVNEENEVISIDNWKSTHTSEQRGTLQVP